MVGIFFVLMGLILCWVCGALENGTLQPLIKLFNTSFIQLCYSISKNQNKPKGKTV